MEKRSIPFEVSFQETGPATPVFFVLSPGVDPLKDVEALGNKLGFTADKKKFHNISLGQVKSHCPMSITSSCSIVAYSVPRDLHVYNYK